MAAAGGHWVKGTFQAASGPGPGIEVFKGKGSFSFLLVDKDADAEDINAMLPDLGERYPAVWDRLAKRWYLASEKYGDTLHEDMTAYGVEVAGTGSFSSFPRYESRYSKAFYIPWRKRLEVITYSPETVSWIAGASGKPSAAKSMQDVYDKSSDRAYKNAFKGVEVAFGDMR